MIKSSIEKLAYDIGKDIGHSDNETQAKLLNGLSHGLNSIIEVDKLNMQISYIVDFLDNESKKIIPLLAEYIEHDKQENK